MKRTIKAFLASCLAISLLNFTPVHASGKPQPQEADSPIATHTFQTVKPVDPAPAAMATIEPIPVAPDPPVTQSAVSSGASAPAASCALVMTGNFYEDYIFSVESGHNPCAINPGGCIGLGQDCNMWLITGRLDSPICGQAWRSDIDCQLRYWDWYANKIYGGWANAYAHRSTHNSW